MNSIVKRFLLTSILVSAAGEELVAGAPLVADSLVPACAGELAVVPDLFAGVDARGGSSLLRDAIRLQQLIGAASFSSNQLVIQQIRLRPSAIFGQAFTSIVANIQIRLSTTDIQPDGMNANFESNHGTNKTVVFNGSLPISSVFSGPTAGPKEFDIIVHFTTPFLYDPVKGNLLIDYQNFSGSAATFVDGNAAPGDRASRAFALGGNSTTATTRDSGIEVLQLCFSQTNRPPPPPPPPSCQPLVVPGVFAGTEARAGSGLLPYPIRLQEVYAGGQFGTQAVVIRELRLRPSARYGSAFTATMSNLQIRLSTTSKQPEALSATFANNVGPDEVVVLNGSLSVSSAFTGPSAGPKDFDIIFPFSTPFVFDPVRGNLLVDWRNVTGSAATFVDAGETVGDGASRAFALGAGSTVATTVDGGAEVIQFCTTPTNGPPPPPPPPVPVCDGDSRVVPHLFAQTEAGAGSSVLRDAIRLQEVYATGQFPAQPLVITQIRWRPSALFGTAFTTTISNLQINLSTTPRGPDGLSAVFAENIGADDTVVFSGPLALSSSLSGPASGPKAFDIVVPLSVPFVYDPTVGNLLVDVRNHSGSTVAFVDAGEAAGDGASRAFALGAGSTTATTLDSGADVLLLCFSLTNRPSNFPPVAQASVVPLVTLHPGQTNLYCLSPNNSNVVVYLDGSQSSDPENDPLEYFWLADDGPLPFAIGLTSTNTLDIGAHSVTLVVSDGHATRQDSVHFEVILLGDAVSVLIAQLEASDLDRRKMRPFIATLKAAMSSFNRGQFNAGVNQLQAFQNKIVAQIATSDPTLADALIATSQIIIDASISR